MYPDLAQYDTYWTRLQRKPLEALDQVLILESAPAIIHNIAQIEMANSDWMLTCTC